MGGDNEKGVLQVDRGIWSGWGVPVAVVTLLFGYVSWVHSDIIHQIDLQLKPLTLLVAENTEARKKGGRYTAEMQLTYSKRVDNQFTECQRARKTEDQRLHTRIDQLFQKMFEFHASHMHDMVKKYEPRVDE